jgi:hypothetical protein
MKLTNTEIQQHIAELPDSVRTAVTTFDWANEILSIGKKFGLHMDQIGDLQYETIMVILGLSPSTAYSNALVHALRIDKNVADEIVIATNAHIFLELQNRAFGPKDDSASTRDDDYLEPIDYNDLHGPMSREGIHLLDEDTSKPRTNLQDEIDQISSDPNIDNRSLDSFEMTSQERDDHIEDNNDSRSKSTLVFRDEFDQKIKPSSVVTHEPMKISDNKGEVNNYNEPIDAADLEGITGHRIDTDILKQQHQNNPDQESSSTPSAISKGRDLGQGEVNLSLDKHLMENSFIAKGDSVDVSPTEQDQIKEEGTFLQNLKITPE